MNTERRREQRRRYYQTVERPIYLPVFYSWSHAPRQGTSNGKPRKGGEVSERNIRIAVAMPMELAFAVIDIANHSNRTPSEVVIAALTRYTQPVQEVVAHVRRGKATTPRHS